VKLDARAGRFREPGAGDGPVRRAREREWPASGAKTQGARRRDDQSRAANA